jgi:chaperonin cofactor prefoldin
MATKKRLVKRPAKTNPKSEKVVEVDWQKECEILRDHIEMLQGQLEAVQDQLSDTQDRIYEERWS